MCEILKQTISGLENVQDLIYSVVPQKMLAQDPHCPCPVVFPRLTLSERLLLLQHALEGQEAGQSCPTSHRVLDLALQGQDLASPLLHGSLEEKLCCVLVHQHLIKQPNPRKERDGDKVQTYPHRQEVGP